MVENAGLTEWPVPLLGKFDPDYLDVPREVIVLTMRTNQKYFACTGADGGLAPAFVCTANIAANDGGMAIVEGNRRVLAARLSDARFFWEQDLKVPLAEQAVKLSGIVFHEKLGTVADKVERVAKLARWLVETGVVPAHAGIPVSEEPVEPAELPSTGIPAFAGTTLADLAERAARLAKADLVTGMVGEFPELQGVIGGYLAAAQGEPREVSDAIRDHYKPVGQGDEVPTAPVTVAVSLADKLDLLLGFFTAGEKPTGSRDPFALRRAALGVLQLTQTNEIRLETRYILSESMGDFFEEKRDLRQSKYELNRLIESLREGDTNYNVVEDSSGLYLTHGDKQISRLDKSRFTDPADAEAYVERAWAGYSDLLDFFVERLKVQQKTLGVRHDVIQAAFALEKDDDFVRLLARVTALQAFVDTPDGTDLLTGYKRAANILAKEGWPNARHPGLEPGPAFSGGDEERRRVPGQARDDAGGPPEETALLTALGETETRADAAIAAEDFTAAMAALASLRAPIDDFFEKVIVNDPDPTTRERRLNLLARFRDAVHRVADFSKIEG